MGIVLREGKTITERSVLNLGRQAVLTISFILCCVMPLVAISNEVTTEKITVSIGYRPLVAYEALRTKKMLSVVNSRFDSRQIEIQYVLFSTFQELIDQARHQVSDMLIAPYHIGAKLQKENYYQVVAGFGISYQSALISLKSHPINSMNDLAGITLGVYDEKAFVTLAVKNEIRKFDEKLLSAIKFEARTHTDILFMDLLEGKFDAVVLSTALVGTLGEKMKERVHVLPLGPVISQDLFMIKKNASKVTPDLARELLNSILQLDPFSKMPAWNIRVELVEFENSEEGAIEEIWDDF